MSVFSHNPKNYHFLNSIYYYISNCVTFQLKSEFSGTNNALKLKFRLSQIQSHCYSWTKFRENLLPINWLNME